LSALAGSVVGEGMDFLKSAFAVEGYGSGLNDRHFTLLGGQGFALLNGSVGHDGIP
jgi:hypothetical protein